MQRREVDTEHAIRDPTWGLMKGFIRSTAVVHAARVWHPRNIYMMT